MQKNNVHPLSCHPKLDRTPIDPDLSQLHASILTITAILTLQKT